VLAGAIQAEFIVGHQAWLGDFIADFIAHFVEYG
jgi:hypothetical protein